MQQAEYVSLLFWPIMPGVKQKATGNAVFIIISTVKKLVFITNIVTLNSKLKSTHRKLKL